MEDLEKTYQNAIDLMASGHRAQARHLFAQFLLQAPDHPIANANMGVLLCEQRLYDAAIIHMRKSLINDPENLESQSNLFNALLRCRRYAEAKTEMERALWISSAPNDQNETRIFADLWTNKGLFEYETGDLENSERSYRYSIKLHEENGSNCDIARNNLPYPVLAQGRLKEGFELHEARWISLQKHPIWSTATPRWNGESCKRLFVHFEQGLGDTLHFSRFLDKLTDRYPDTAVTFAVQPPLIRFMQENFPRVHVIGPDEVPLCDYYIPLMSLPNALGLYRIEDYQWSGFKAQPPQAGAPYLGNCPLLKVGLVWAGNPGQEADVHRSMPFKHLMALADPRVILFSLQVGDRSKDIARAGAEGFVFDLSPWMTDFSASASLVKQLDLVVTVCTGALHLCAGLNVPTLGLVPYVRCWRWLRDREDSPSYPSLRLIDQDTPYNWAGQVEKARAIIQEKLNG